MNQFAKKDHVIAAATETMLAGMRRQRTAGWVRRLKTAKSTIVVVTPTMQKSRNCLAGSIAYSVANPRRTMRRTHCPLQSSPVARLAPLLQHAWFESRFFENAARS